MCILKILGTKIMKKILVLLAFLGAYTYLQSEQAVFIPKFYRKDASNTYVLHDEPAQFQDLLRAMYAPNQSLLMPIRWVMRTKKMAQVNGAFANSSVSTRNIVPFINQYSIDMDEFILTPDQYTSFNHFFTRELKQGAREISQNPLDFISPADSKLLVVPNITSSQSFVVKNTGFTLKEFLGSTVDSTPYEDGILMIFRLAPYDYHRYHFPVACIPTPAITLEGMLETVNPIAYYNGCNALCLNERHLTELITNKSKYPIIAVSVGAMFVGAIKEVYTPYEGVSKGDEMGYFEFGGSTLVLVIPKGILELNPVFAQHSQNNYETEVKMGEIIGQLVQ